MAALVDERVGLKPDLRSSHTDACFCRWRPREALAFQGRSKVCVRNHRAVGHTFASLELFEVTIEFCSAGFPRILRFEYLPTETVKVSLTS